MGRVCPPRTWGKLIIVAAITAGCGPAGPEDATLGSYLRLYEPPVDGKALTVCADGETVFGMDVSKWQGTVDWAKVARAGVKFAFIRVSDGLSYPDGQYLANWAGAKANGILRGTYQFFRANEDPIAQADYLLDNMGPLEQFDLPPVIDVESTDGQTSETLASNVGAWIDRVETALGVAPVIYSGKYFWQENVGSDAFANYPLWVAQWGTSCPNLPDQWGAWRYWQYSAQGAVDGVVGNVDLNEFNGPYAGLVEQAAVEPVCGDGFCSPLEDHASCPDDCPICEPIGPVGRIIDDDDLCFTAGGAAQYIRVVTDTGYGGGLKWTKSWVSARVENYGLWSLSFEEAGTYRIEAYVDESYGQWTRTPYQVHHDGDTSVFYVDQTGVDGWVEIGDVDFAAGGDQWMRIDDAVQDELDAGLQIVFDAVRLTRLDAPTEEPPPKTEPPEQPPAEPPLADDTPNTGVRSAPQGGCSCNSSGASQWPLALLLLGFWPLNRRRR